MKQDRLDKMFATQYEFQKSLGTWEKIQTPADKQQFLNQMFLACMEEIIEVMRETAYKNPDYVPFGWKKTQEINTAALKEELIDLWHFIMNIALTIGMTPKEFTDIYNEKMRVNIERQKNKY